jgi:hypothetical protein
VKKVVCGVFGAMAVVGWTAPVQAQAKDQATDQAFELAVMPSTMTVTLLNDGGKYVVVELRHIPQGGPCRMDKDDPIIRIGSGSSPETTRVRSASPQLSAGGCPFLTMFDMTNTDYAAGRAAFLNMKDEGLKKVEGAKKELSEKAEEVRKELGRQWEQIFGEKK